MKTSTEQLQDSPSESPDGVAILTKAERVQLLYCEQRIEAGMASFKEVGRALASVRNGKLYRDAHSSFEAYLQERWHMGRTYAYNLMQAAEIAAEVSAIADIQTESHARELAKVEPEKRAEVIQEAAKEGPVTAKKIKEAAKRVEVQAEEPEPPARIQIHTPDDLESMDYRASLAAQSVIGLAREKLSVSGMGAKQFRIMADSLFGEAERLAAVADDMEGAK